jgi:Bacterial protein of unknown function (DUF885)
MAGFGRGGIVGERSPFSRFVKDYFDAECRWNPSWATRTGFHEYDGDLAGRSEAAHRTRLAELETFRERARVVAGTDLGASERSDLTLVSHRIEADILELATIGMWRRNPIGYLWYAAGALDALMKRPFAPPPRRLEALTARLRAFPRILDDMKANVSDPPREYTEVALRLARGSMGFVDDAIGAWARDAAGGDPSLRAEFESVHPQAVAALEDARDWLNGLLPRSGGHYAIGADALAKLLEHEEMTDTPLDVLLEIAQATLGRDYEDFVVLAGRIDANRTPGEVAAGLSEDHPAEDALLDWARETVNRVRAFLTSRGLVSLPEVAGPKVIETPPWYRFGAFAAMDSPGAYETVAREAFYYVTPPEADWSPQHREAHLRLFNRPVMDLITIHETWPGHFLQFANASRFPTHTRRLISCGSNVEGWAHYVEQMMIEEGYGDGDPKIRLAQIQEALIRDCRFVAAIGLHSGTLDVEGAARLFSERAFMEPENAQEEARRGTFDPTYLVYTLGKLQIYKLRDDWEAANGGRDLRKFHDAFLLEGGAPIRLLRGTLLDHDDGETLYDASSYRTPAGS